MDIIKLNLNSTLPFGKYKGVLIQDMLNNDDSIKYLIWFNNTITTHKFTKNIEKELNEWKEYYEKQKKSDAIYAKSWMNKPCKYIGSTPDQIDFDLGLCGQT